MKAFILLLCLLLCSFAFAKIDDTTDVVPAPDPSVGYWWNITTDTWPADSRNGLQGYAFRLDFTNVQPQPPQEGSQWNYYLRMTIIFQDLSEKFFIDFEASTDKRIDYYVKGEHSTNSTMVLQDPQTGKAQNGWVSDGLHCGIFGGTIYSEIPVEEINVIFVPTGPIIQADNTSVCWEDNGYGSDAWEYDGEDDDGVRLFLISFFSTFGLLLFVFSLCLCCFACVRSCRYKCRARRCGKASRKASAQVELKASTQLAASSTPEVAAPVAQEQVYGAPLYPVYPEFPQYPQYSMLAATPQQYYSDQPQVQYVAFHPMMFPYPQPQQQQQQNNTQQ